MTQDKIIRMAYEAGAIKGEHTVLNHTWFELTADQLERFAALVAAHEREKQAEQEPVAWMNDSTPSGVFARHKKGAENFGCTIPLYAAPVSIEAAVLAEREACAKVCESDEMRYECSDECAAAIRARGDK